MEHPTTCRAVTKVCEFTRAAWCDNTTARGRDRGTTLAPPYQQHHIRSKTQMTLERANRQTDRQTLGRHPCVSVPSTPLRAWHPCPSQRRPIHFLYSVQVSRRRLPQAGRSVFSPSKPRPVGSGYTRVWWLASMTLRAGKDLRYARSTAVSRFRPAAKRRTVVSRCTTALQLRSSWGGAPPSSSHPLRLPLRPRRRFVRGIASRRLPIHRRTALCALAATARDDVVPHRFSGPTASIRASSRRGGVVSTLALLRASGHGQASAKKHPNPSTLAHAISRTVHGHHQGLAPSSKKPICAPLTYPYMTAFVRC